MAEGAEVEMADATQNAIAFVSDAELDEKFPNRPRNHKPGLPFHDLFLYLFNPLNENRKTPRGPAVRARAKVGPHGPTNKSPHEQRRIIIERFFTRWRNEVGPDVYPALRLIVPEKDRDRAMYGMKEKAIGKILVKIMRIDKNSEDGYNLINWKLPGQSAASRMAGDFAGRCFEVLSKRPIRTDLGDMTIDEVNDLLDKLSQAQREQTQLPIFQEFYARMNPMEMMWLIRIILRQMKVGATERTFFTIFHPDAEALFNVSSSLRRVCWELWNPDTRLEPDDVGISLMECFQPQLAQFQMHGFDKMLAKMQPTEKDREFWIEEKLDGERMQMHMVSDPTVAGGKRFAFWSRKAKDYTYLYGSGFYDDNSALTRHLKEAFDERVDNIILDGEMITWDPEQDAMVPFGTLKTAALEQQRNPFSTTGHRPLYSIFDILYLNDQALTSYTLRDRRKALEASIRSVPQRFQLHSYQKATTVQEIEPKLRKVIAEAGEGLVLKNPRSAYRLNDRNDDWLKVKPEYMQEFGESLDCIVVGGYYGSGSRGGNLSSFLCGLVVARGHVPKGENPQKCWSFCKVGGGFDAQAYSNLRHATEGKWMEWDPKKPPTDWVELAGGELQHERPDVWIKPEDSVVIEVKAASVTPTDQFRLGKTLRFPRFKRLRTDRDWTNALSLQEFLDLENNVQRERNEKFQVDDERKKRLKQNGPRKKPWKVAGGSISEIKTAYAGPETFVFEGLTFFIMSESLVPQRKTKPELEQLVKANGGGIRQTYDAVPDTICVADKRLVKVASLQKRGDINIVRPKWLFDCIKQSEKDLGRSKFLLPFEPDHMLFTRRGDVEGIKETVDEYGDSFARDVTVEELRQIFDSMPAPRGQNRASAATIRGQLEAHGHPFGDLHGLIFKDLTLCFDYGGGSSNESGTSTPSSGLAQASLTARFAGAIVVSDLSDSTITHIVTASDRRHLRTIRAQLAERHRLPRIVHKDWVEHSWAEGTLLDEEQFGIV